MIKYYNALSGVIIVTFLFCSCSPLISFETSQPKGISPEKEFGEDALGSYLAVDINRTDGIETDSCWIHIYKKIVVMHENNTNFNSMSLTDFNKRLKDTTNKSDSVICKIIYKSDSVFITSNKEKDDTMFIISDVNVLKKWDDKLYLNFKVDEQSQWIVYQLDFNSTSLSVNSVNDTTDLPLLQQISKYRVIKDTPDTTGKERIKNYIFNPKKTEFDQFINLGGFHNRQKFKRVANLLL